MERGAGIKAAGKRDADFFAGGQRLKDRRQDRPLYKNGRPARKRHRESFFWLKNCATKTTPGVVFVLLCVYIHSGYTHAVKTVDPAPETMLPLQPAVFHILMAVADDDRHGYAIIQDVALRTDGAVKLSAGTLYRSIQRMLDDGLIVEVEDRPDPEEDDERRRYYRITPFGRAVARAEAQRLTDLIKLARASGFIPKKA